MSRKTIPISTTPSALVDAVLDANKRGILTNREKKRILDALEGTRVKVDSLLEVEDKKNTSGVPTEGKDAQQKALRITVNYEISPKDLIKAGKYDYINGNFGKDEFLGNLFADNRKEESQKSCEIFLFVPRITERGYITTDEVLRQIDREGFTPCSARELLSAGATEKYQDFQRKNPIIGLGSSALNVSGSTVVPVLDGDDYYRFLYLPYRDLLWNDNCRFLVRRK